MNKKLAIISGCALLALAAWAASPSYTTKSANGNSTAGAEVIFPSAAQSQIRVVNVNWNSDSNTAVLSYSTGAGAYYVSVTNAATSSTTNQINTTNGLVAGRVLVLESGGVGYAATMSSFNSNATWGCYYVLPSGGWGVATTVNDDIYQMGTATTVPVGETTNSANGEGVFVGAVGRPVRIQLTPAAVTNKINSAVARYE
jgi:hypothetical protein